jgi:hypothetical protein
MSVQLKIKQKHLALEPAVIKTEERKILSRIRGIKNNASYIANSEKLIYELEFTFNNLVNHRRWDVRNESRATHLARAYIVGKEYKSVEIKRHEQGEYAFRSDIIPRIVKMVTKYGKPDQRKVTKEQILEWAKI